MIVRIRPRAFTRPTIVAETDPEESAASKSSSPVDVKSLPPLVRGAYFFSVRLDAFATLTGKLAAVLAWVIFILGLFNVITRYLSRFIERDIIIGEVFDLQWMLFGLLFLVALNYGVKEGVNPRIDFWWADFTPKRKARIDIVLHILLFIPFCWMAIGVLSGYVASALGRNFDGTWPTWKVWQIWEQSPDAGGLPRGPIKAMILIGFVFLTMQILSEVFRNYLVLAGHEELSSTDQSASPLRVE